MTMLSSSRGVQMTLAQKFWQINWGLILLLALVSSIGFAMLYSAAGGSFEPWAVRQMARFAAGCCIMLMVAMVDLRVWMRYAYLIYGIGLMMLVWVDLAGVVGMGAQRWINIGPLSIQPSEIMKVAIVLVLARYFHGLSHEQVGRPQYLVWPLMLVVMPSGLVLVQPDLGTAGMLIMTSGMLFLLAGVRLWKFAIVIAGGGAMLPIAWGFLRDYQKNRVLTFMNPESDPLGSGYHIMQSKIALGSGGIFGKGFLEGSQAHLNFLPEKQTDFIFTALAEEWGIVGGLTLLALYSLIIAYGYAIALRSRSQFGRLLALGLTSMFFLYVFINVAMVMGLLPVVGVPLPLVSYGGTSMLTLLFSFGLIIGVYIHRDTAVGRSGAE
ncbi:MAG TPA: rod shape-determining protein RodA [Alphaproteobacteria bacterium]|nr:rod shape-determining protein RodA [Alphaproteobacteria bacterium]